MSLAAAILIRSLVLRSFAELARQGWLDTVSELEVNEEVIEVAELLSQIGMVGLGKEVVFNSEKEGVRLLWGSVRSQ